jgi:DNA polymerase
MPLLYRDYETRSTLDPEDVGAWRYSTHASTDVWCCAYAVDDAEVKLWVPGDPVPAEFTEAASNPEWLAAAFNDSFERLVEAHIMAPRYGWHTVPIERHRCLQAATLARALPGSLKGAAAALKLPQQKDDAGRRVMLQMSRPRKPRKDEDPKGVYWFDDEERRQQLYAYCKQDVITERELHKRIPFLEGGEQILWILDQAINDRGVHIDRQLLEAALKIAEQAQAEINVELEQITAGEIDSIHQVARLLDWLNAHGAELKSIRKGTLEKALEGQLPDTARRVIELRLDGAHAAAKKLDTMRSWLNRDNRARGTLKFHGASTGRWSSHGIQLQNMKRPTVEDIDVAMAAVASGSLEHLRKYYLRPMSVVGDVTRGMICAAPGCRLIAADLSGIESRVTAWVSGQESKLAMWRRFDETHDPKDEPYYLIGKTLGVPEDKARSIGKTADLAFGYMGGVGAWQKLAPDDASSEDVIKKRQYRWRDAHPQTREFWTALNAKAVKAVKNPHQRVKFQNPIWRHISFESNGVFLFMQLPSGRRIAYPHPTLRTTYRGNAAVVFMDWGVRGWGECRFGQGAYGGTWIENAVQAIARDIIAEAMPRLEAAGYRIVLHVHDEVVAEVPDGFGSAEEFLQIFATPPEWAADLPLAAKVRIGPRFCKSKSKQIESEPTALTEPDPIEEMIGPGPTAERIEPKPAGAPEPEPQEARATKEESPLWEEHAFNGYQSGERMFGNAIAEYIYLGQDNKPHLMVRRTTAKQFPQFHFEDGCWVKGAPKGPRIPFMLPELIAAAPETAIWITEGEKDALNVSGLGLIATTNSGGAGKWSSDLNQWFKGRQTALILEDNDPAGRAHARKVANALYAVVPEVRIVSFAELPEHGDVSDWLQGGGTKQQLLDRAKAAPKFERTPDQLESQRAANVSIVALEWLWPDRFVIGKLGIIAGLPDEGKGLLIADMAARVTRGLAWPCKEGIAPQGNVILLSAEDDPRDTTVPRLIAAGADLDRIEIVAMVRSQNEARMFSLVTDLELLRAKILAMGDVKLVQIDPISAYLGVGKIDSFRTTDVRAVLGPLVNLAAEVETAIAGIMHFNKKTDVTNALLRISDSLAFGAAARHVYAVVNDAENHRKLLVKGKNNLAPQEQKALAFEFDTRKVGVDAKTGKEIWAPYIVWQSEHVDVTATEAMQAAAESKAPAARDTAKNFLKEMLVDGPVAQTDVEEAARANGIAERTLHRAKADLKIRAVKDGPMKDGQRTWRWHPAPPKGQD